MQEYFPIYARGVIHCVLNEPVMTEATWWVSLSWCEANRTWFSRQLELSLACQGIGGWKKDISTGICKSWSFVFQPYLQIMQISLTFGWAISVSFAVYPLFILKSSWTVLIMLAFLPIAFKRTSIAWKIFKQVRKLCLQLWDMCHVCIVCTSRWKIQTISKMFFMCKFL